MIPHGITRRSLKVFYRLFQSYGSGRASKCCKLDFTVMRNEESATPGLLKHSFRERISVIIPTLNEAPALTTVLSAGICFADVEIIVVDGGSQDQTVELARSNGWKVLSSPTGRARQMNAGAAAACGEILLFLHADTRLPEGFDDHVRLILSRPGVVAGAFRLRIDSPKLGLRIIEKLANWRSRRWQMPYGDQALFLSAEEFRSMSGFPDVPLMEDVEFVRRLRKQGRIDIASVPVITSARRWEEIGVWKTTLINQLCLWSYLLGVKPSRMERWYHRNCRTADPKQINASAAPAMGGKSRVAR